MTSTSYYEPEWTEEVLEKDQEPVETATDVPDGILYVVDENDEVILGNEKLAEWFEDSSGVSDVRESVSELSDRHIATDLDTETGERIPDRWRRTTIFDEASGERYQVGITRGVTERKQHEGEHQRNGTETLSRLHGLLLELAQTLFETSTREDIERIVCERLADSELYELAWIGKPEHNPNGSGIVPVASAGIDDGDVETLTTTDDGGDSEQAPCRRALRTGKVQISQAVSTKPMFEHCHGDVLDRSVRSTVAVPLVDGETTYGCLTVYAARALAFNWHEQSALAMLGETIGFVINAIETRRLLLADAVLELEFRLADPDQFLVRHSERFECTLSVESYVATRSGEWLLYVSVRGASPATLCEAADDIEGLKRVRVVSDHSEDSLVEYRFETSSFLRTLTDAGAKLQSAGAANGVGRFVVEAPQSANVRDLIGRIREIYPQVNLLAQRERDRSVAEVEVPGGPLSRLTERQREALETAYHAGYFDWPRESTAEEVAASMGIAASTLHRHFRRAEKRLLSAFFDPGASTSKRTR